MTDNPVSLATALVGYTGIGISIVAGLAYWDGRIGFLLFIVGLFGGLFVNGAASIYELQRNEGSRDWFREVITYAAAGEVGKTLKVLRGEKV